MGRGQSKGTIAKCKEQLAIFLKALAKQYIPAEKVGETTIKEVNELQGALAEAGSRRGFGFKIYLNDAQGKPGDSRCLVDA